VVVSTLKRSERSFEESKIGGDEPVRVEDNRRFESPRESASVRDNLHGLEGLS
jgi:hypothetical protein